MLILSVSMFVKNILCILLNGILLFYYQYIINLLLI